MTNRFLLILLFNVIALEASDKMMNSSFASSSSNFTLDGLETDEKTPFTIGECAINAELVNSYPIRSSSNSTLDGLTTKVLSPALSASSQAQSEKNYSSQTNGSEDANDFVVIEDYKPKSTEEKLKEAYQLHIANAAKMAVLEEKGKWQEQQIQLLELYKSDIDEKLKSKTEQLTESQKENEKQISELNVEKNTLVDQLKDTSAKFQKTEANLTCVKDALSKRIDLTNNLYAETASKDKQIKNTKIKLTGVQSENDALFKQLNKTNKELANTQTNLSQTKEALTKSTDKLAKSNCEIVEKEKQLSKVKDEKDELFEELKTTKNSLNKLNEEYQSFLDTIEYSTKLDIAKTIIQLHENKIMNHKSISNEAPEDKSAKFFITKTYNIQSFIDNPKENHEVFLAYLQHNYYNILKGSPSKNLSSLLKKLGNRGVFEHAEQLSQSFKDLKESKDENNHKCLSALLQCILRESIYMKERIIKNIQLIYEQIKNAPVLILDISEVETAMTKHYTYESEALNDLAHNTIIINNTMQEIRDGMDKASDQFPKDKRLF